MYLKNDNISDKLEGGIAHRKKKKKKQEKQDRYFRNI